MTIRRSFLQQIALVALFFAAVTGIIYADILRSPSVYVLAGQQVGAFFVWLIWWWHFALTHHLPLFHSSLMMFPEGFPVFPHSPINELPGVLLQFVTTPYAAVNLLQLATHVLTAVTAFLLFHRLTKDTQASVCGAFTYAFSNYMLVQHFHGQLIEATLFFNPLLALAFLNYLENPRRSNAVMVGAAFMGVTMSGPYVGFSFGFFFLLGTALYDLISGQRRLYNPAVYRPLLLAIGVPLLLALAVYWPLVKYAGQWIGGSVFYSTYLLSFVDAPFWHRSGLIQTLRPLRNMNYAPEMAMGYVGWGTVAAIAFGFWRRGWKNESFRFWGWIFAFSAVLSLGPWLRISPALETKIPLPYQIFLHLPLFSSFRNTSRILMTATLASSALTALSLSWLFAKRPALFRTTVLAAFIGFTFWEFDMARIGKRYASAEPSAAYQTIKSDAAPVAILELPIFYEPSGDIFVSGLNYMLLQPYHLHPMVLGWPSRFLAQNLAFTESTPAVFELTHPQVLSRLDEEKELRERAVWLAKNGSQELSRHGIGYVLYHTRDPFFTPEGHAVLARWLTRIFGKPILVDERGICLYRTGQVQ